MHPPKINLSFNIHHQVKYFVKVKNEDMSNRQFSVRKLLHSLLSLSCIFFHLPYQSVYCHRILPDNDYLTSENNPIDEYATTDDTHNDYLHSIIKDLKNQSRRLDTHMPTSPDDHLVTSLPYLDPKSFQTKQYAGYLSASEDNDKRIFYWLFEPDFSDPIHSSSNEGTADHNRKSGLPTYDNTDSVPLLIWLNGGPGCSSMEGLWVENGPFRLKKEKGKKLRIEINPFSWHR